MRIWIAGRYLSKYLGTETLYIGRCLAGMNRRFSFSGQGCHARHHHCRGGSVRRMSILNDLIGWLTRALLSVCRGPMRPAQFHPEAKRQGNHWTTFLPRQTSLCFGFPSRGSRGRRQPQGLFVRRLLSPRSEYLKASYLTISPIALLTLTLVPCHEHPTPRSPARFLRSPFFLALRA